MIKIAEFIFAFLRKVLRGAALQCSMINDQNKLIIERYSLLFGHRSLFFEAKRKVLIVENNIREISSADSSRSAAVASSI